MRTWEIRTWRSVLVLISLVAPVAPLSSVSAQVSQGRVQSMKLLTANVSWATTDYVVMGRGAAGRLFRLGLVYRYDIGSPADLLRNRPERSDKQ